MVVQELLSLRQQQAPSCQMSFLGTHCHFLDEIFYSRSHWIWSKVERPLNAVVGDWENHVALMLTESEQNDCKWSFAQLYQPMGVSTPLCKKWNNFYLFWFRLGCAWLWLAGKFLHKRRWLFFFVVATRLSCKTRCTVTTKQHNCRFLVLKMNIRNVAAGFALFTVVEISRFIGSNVDTLFISTCWTIHISNNLLYFAVHIQFFLSIFGGLKWDIR